MDSLTHALLGATISHALFGKAHGRRAAAIGALAGVLPDADSVISSKSDPLLYVEFHRFFTHSLLFAFAGALIAIVPWLIHRRKMNGWHSLWLCALPAYFSHCLLDACTTYGTQIYWPLNRERIGWNLISIIDPICTVGLGILLFIALKKQQRAWAQLAIAFVAGYLAIGGLQKTRAFDAQMILAEKRGHKPERSTVMPTMGNNIVWRSLYLADGKIQSDRIRVGWFKSPTIREGSSLPHLSVTDLSPTEHTVNNATRAFERFSWFSAGWLARAPFDRSILGDMRYSLSTGAFDPVWGIRLSDGESGPRVEWINRQRERKPDVRELWNEIRGNHPGYKELHSSLPLLSVESKLSH